MSGGNSSGERSQEATRSSQTSGKGKDGAEVHSGLAGVTSHRSSVSSIIGTTLTYRGINIDEIAANGSFEEMVGLLWSGIFPTKEPLEEMEASLPRQVN